MFDGWLKTEFTAKLTQKLITKTMNKIPKRLRKSNQKKKAIKKMNKFDKTAKQEKEDILWKIRNTEDINEILFISRNPDPKIRLKAIQQLCPCEVKRDIDEFWARLFEMVDDENDEIRQQVLHNLCDGSPPHLEHQIYAALDKFNCDPNKEIRRTAHKVLSTYLRTGKWNIL